MDIREALSNLDVFDDKVWTSDGLPMVDAVKELLGRPVTRQEIIEAAPKFTRENPDLSVDETETEAPEVQEQEPEKDPVDLEEFLGSEPVDVNTFLRMLDRVPTSQLHDLKEGLDEQKKGFKDLRSKLDEYEHRVNGAVTMVRARISREIPDISDKEANRAYLESQQKLREQKKAATVQLLQGVKLSDLDPRAPIDRAFARKTARGTKRPGT